MECRDIFPDLHPYLSWDCPRVEEYTRGSMLETGKRPPGQRSGLIFVASLNTMTKQTGKVKLLPKVSTITDGEKVTDR